MSHYFINDKKLASKKRHIIYNINDKNFDLISDSGIFSKNELDYGSRLLILNALKLNLGTTILDMGCGYGPIGITIASFVSLAKVTCVDINERAVQLCQENILASHLENCRALISDGFSSINQQFDTILINPPIRAGKEIIYNMFEHSFNHLNDFGTLLIVIRKDQGALSAKKKLENLFDECVMVDRSKGYMILRCVKKI